MDTIRVRVELNKGRVGMPLGKLAMICTDLVAFLNLLSSDIGVGTEKNDWLAERFENASVDFDIRLGKAVSFEQAAFANRALATCFGSGSDDWASLRLRPDTKAKFIQTFSHLDVDETAKIGLYNPAADDALHWFEIPHQSNPDLVDGLIDRGEYGEIQGTVHSLVKEGPKPYLKVRELSCGELVKCYFSKPMYKVAHELLADSDAVIFVEGWLRLDPATLNVSRISVEGFRLAPNFDLANYQQMRGSMPDFLPELDLPDEELIP